MYSRSFQRFGNTIESFSIHRVGSIESRSVKENQAVASELRTIRNRINDYRQRLFGKRARCSVPDWGDNVTKSNVDELGTVNLNDWIVAAL